jgi:2-keto-4-pentenoate hydratase/2-oxohepta-3-ene-1,7-dioic acid hydratase in catechol pathway
VTASRFVRFAHPQGTPCWGLVEGDRVQPLSRAPWLHDCAPVGHLVARAALELLVPAEPTKIVCIGQNYRKHAEEMGKVIPPEPLIFLKPPSALNGPGAPIRLPQASAEVHHEAELAVIIGQRLSGGREDQARAAIFGISCFNDVTARDIQRREVQHTRGKGYDTFACLGPALVRGVDFADLAVRCRVNGALRQEGRTSDMAFSPARLVAFISSVMTLEPGDVVSTGTPSGVGRLEHGDTVQVEVEGVGVLENPVRGRPADDAAGRTADQSGARGDATTTRVPAR